VRWGRRRSRHSKGRGNRRINNGGSEWMGEWSLWRGSGNRRLNRGLRRRKDGCSCCRRCNRRHSHWSKGRRGEKSWLTDGTGDAGGRGASLRVSRVNSSGVQRYHRNEERTLETEQSASNQPSTQKSRRRKQGETVEEKQEVVCATTTEGSNGLKQMRQTYSYQQYELT